MKTQTDKTEEIQSLIKQIIENDKHEAQHAFNLAKQLDSYGSDIVNPILSKFRTYRTEGKFPNLGDYLGLSIFFLVDEATKFAEPQHAMQLAEMLLWPEIVLDGHERSTRGKFIEALKRIGNISIVHLLKEYAEKIKQVVYSDQETQAYEDFPATTAEQLHEMDQQEIADAIKSCQQRPTK